MPYSNCCDAYTNMEELGICPDCKDHCEFYDKCEICNGLGVYEDKLCPVCRGEGVVDCIPYKPKFIMKPTSKK